MCGILQKYLELDQEKKWNKKNHLFNFRADGFLVIKVNVYSSGEQYNGFKCIFEN